MHVFYDGWRTAGVSHILGAMAIAGGRGEGVRMKGNMGGNITAYEYAV